MLKEGVTFLFVRQDPDQQDRILLKTNNERIKISECHL